jgi:hypothetical protein
MKPLPLLIAAVCFALPALAEQAQQPHQPAPTLTARSEKADAVRSESGNLDTAGRTIMRLTEDMVIRGRPCKKGWLRLHPNGVPSSFTAAREIQFGKLQIPADTWVMQNEKSLVLVCAFPSDIEIHGVLCKGTGGAKGVQVALYASGALKRVFLAQDSRIQGVPCAANIFSGAVDFYENGRLKSCKLSDSFTIDGVPYKKGARLQFPATEQRSVSSD